MQPTVRGCQSHTASQGRPCNLSLEPTGAATRGDSLPERKLSRSHRKRGNQRHRPGLGAHDPVSPCPGPEPAKALLLQQACGGPLHAGQTGRACTEGRPWTVAYIPEEGMPRESVVT